MKENGGRLLDNNSQIQCLIPIYLTSLKNSYK